MLEAAFQWGSAKIWNGTLQETTGRYVGLIHSGIFQQVLKGESSRCYRPAVGRRLVIASPDGVIAHNAHVDGRLPTERTDTPASKVHRPAIARAWATRLFPRNP